MALTICDMALICQFDVTLIIFDMLIGVAHLEGWAKPIIALWAKPIYHCGIGPINMLVIT